jgi:hypothetical protein
MAIDNLFDRASSVMTVISSSPSRASCGGPSSTTRKPTSPGGAAQLPFADDEEKDHG